MDECLKSRKKREHTNELAKNYNFIDKFKFIKNIKVNKYRYRQYYLLAKKINDLFYLQSTFVPPEIKILHNLYRFHVKSLF